MTELKAYIATVPGGEHSGDLYFAKSNLEARKACANEHNEGELGGVHCHRAQWADHYKHRSRVPSMDLIDHGWWFDCEGCCTTIDSDCEAWDDGEYRALDPVQVSANVLYCSWQCMVNHRDSKTRKSDFSLIIRDMFIQLLRRKLPKARPVPLGSRSNFDGWYCHLSLTDDWFNLHQAWLPFYWPGAKHGYASMRYEDGALSYSVANGDLEAFNIWRGGAACD